jgi:hypothetical protein
MHSLVGWCKSGFYLKQTTHRTKYKPRKLFIVVTDIVYWRLLNEIIIFKKIVALVMAVIWSFAVIYWLS